MPEFRPLAKYLWVLCSSCRRSLAPDLSRSGASGLSGTDTVHNLLMRDCPQVAAWLISQVLPAIGRNTPYLFIRKSFNGSSSSLYSAASAASPCLAARCRTGGGCLLQAPARGRGANIATLFMPRKCRTTNKSAIGLSASMSNHEIDTGKVSLLTVTEANAGQRVDNFLLSVLKG